MILVVGKEEKQKLEFRQVQHKREEEQDAGDILPDGVAVVWTLRGPSDRYGDVGGTNFRRSSCRGRRSF